MGCQTSPYSDKTYNLIYQLDAKQAATKALVKGAAGKEIKTHTTNKTLILLGRPALG